MPWPTSIDAIPLLSDTARMNDPGKEHNTVENMQTVAIQSLQNVLLGPLFTNVPAKNRVEMKRTLWFRGTGDDRTRGPGLKFFSDETDGYSYLCFFPERRDEGSPDVEMVVNKYAYNESNPNTTLERRWVMRSTYAPTSALVDRLSLDYASDPGYFKIKSGSGYTTYLHCQSPSFFIGNSVYFKMDPTVDANGYYRMLTVENSSTGPLAQMDTLNSRRRKSAGNGNLDWSFNMMTGDTPSLRIYRADLPDAGGGTSLSLMRFLWDGNMVQHYPDVTGVAPTTAFWPNQTISFAFNETGNTLQIRAKRSNGVVVSGTVALV